jgi:transcriptional regulator with XRE-family HTH domain
MEKSNSRTTIVSRLQEVREKRGLTQKDVAQALGVSESTVANWENGRTGADTFERLDKLCKLLSTEKNTVQLSDLYKEITDPGIPLGNEIQADIDKIFSVIGAAADRCKSDLANFIYEKYVDPNSSEPLEAMSIAESLITCITRMIELETGNALPVKVSTTSRRMSATRTPGAKPKAEPTNPFEVSDMQIQDLSLKITQKIMSYHINK